MGKLNSIFILLYLFITVANFGQSNVGVSPSGYLTSLPPEIPTLESPLNLETDLPVDIVLTWYPQLHTSSCSLQVSKSSDFSTLLIDLDNLSDKSYSLTGLENNTTYFWQVKAVNVAGESDFSSPWEFTTIMAIPEMPVLAEPADGSGNNPVNVDLIWNSVVDAESYSLRVSKYSDFYNLLIDLSNLPDTSYSLTGLENNTTYFWRVRSANIAGNGDFSKTWDFTTIPLSSVTKEQDNISLQAFPNPFNSRVTISFELTETTKISLVIYNSTGQAVYVLNSEERQAGKHLFTWDGKDSSGEILRCGIYYCLLITTEWICAHKLILIR